MNEFHSLNCTVWRKQLQHKKMMHKKKHYWDSHFITKPTIFTLFLSFLERHVGMKKRMTKPYHGKEHCYSQHYSSERADECSLAAQTHDDCHPPCWNHNESHLECEIKFVRKFVAANAGKSCYVSSLCNLERIPLNKGTAILSRVNNVTKREVPVFCFCLRVAARSNFCTSAEAGCSLGVSNDSG